MVSLMRSQLRGGGSWVHTRRLTVGALVAFVGAVSATGSAPRRTTSARPAPDTTLRSISVTFVVEGHARFGAMAANSASLSKRTSVGEDVDTTLGAGSPEDRDICLVETAPPTPSYVRWQFHATVRSASTERVELGLAWTRRTADTSAVEEGSGTIALRLGESHLIDVVSAADDQPTRCSHVSVRVTATRYFPVSGDLLVHRLWLVHEQGGRRWTSDPVEAIGTVGESVPFRFRPLRWNLAGTLGATSPGPRVEMDVRGSVTTDAADDGRLDTRVDLKREVRVQSVTQSGSGSMRVEAHAGEAGVIELPAPGGVCQVPAADIPAGPLAPGVARRGKFVEVRSEQFFSGGKTSLVITVEQVR